MKRSKRISEEVFNLVKDRSTIEEEYGKKLTKLAKNFNPKEENGFLNDSFQVIRNELERSARAHLDLAQDLKLKLATSIQEFIDSQTSVRKSHQKIMERDVQLKNGQELYVMKSRDRYIVKCEELASLDQTIRTCQLPGKEIDKLKAKKEKVVLQMKQADQDYRSSTDKLQELFQIWKTSMSNCCLVHRN